MAERDITENGYTLLLGGTGTDYIKGGLIRLGFCFYPATTPERCLSYIRGALVNNSVHGLVLTDTLMPDRPIGAPPDGRQQLIILLEQLQKMEMSESVNVQLITRQDPDEAWKIFSRFGVVNEIHRSVNPIMFAADLLRWLKCNNELPRPRRRQAGSNQSAAASR